MKTSHEAGSTSAWAQLAIALVATIVGGVTVWWLTANWPFESDPPDEPRPPASTASDPATDGVEPSTQPDPRAARPVVVQLEGGSGFQHGFFTPSGSIVTIDSGLLDDEVTARWTVDGQERTSGLRVQERSTDSPLALLRPTETSGPAAPFPIGSLSDVAVDDRVVLYMGPRRQARLDVRAIGFSRQIGGQTVSDLLETTRADVRGAAGAPILTTDGTTVAMLFGGSSDSFLSISMSQVRSAFVDALE